MSGIWLLAHDCGLQAFSENHIVNDTFQLIFHSAHLVPYHSWKNTHRQHHSNTGSAENDSFLVPTSRDDSKHFKTILVADIGGQSNVQHL